MSDISKISDSSELISDLLVGSEAAADPMAALHAAIKHRDACTNDICALCAVFRKHEQKRRDEVFGWGRKIRVDETMSLNFLLSGEAGEERRFEHTFVLGTRVLIIGKTSMRVSLRDSAKEDGDAVTISDWATGDKKDEQWLGSRSAKFFEPNPLGSGTRLALLRDGGTLGFTASFREAATLSVNLWGQLRAGR